MALSQSFLHQIIPTPLGERRRSSSTSYAETMKLSEMLAKEPANSNLQRKLERAALTAGPERAAAEKYDEACDVWFALRAIGSSRDNANRNLAISAVKGARVAEAAQDDRTALRFWRFLLEAEPHSDIGAQGVIRCTKAILLAQPITGSLAATVPSSDGGSVRGPAPASKSLWRNLAHAVLRRAPGRVSSAIATAQSAGEAALAQPQDVNLQRKFARSAALAAKLATASERYEEACQILSTQRRFDPGNDQARSNLAIAALRGARKAEGEGRTEDALRFWRHLQDAEPNSRPAAQGISRCMRNLI